MKFRYGPPSGLLTAQYTIPLFQSLCGPKLGYAQRNNEINDIKNRTTIEIVIGKWNRYLSGCEIIKNFKWSATYSRTMGHSKTELTTEVVELIRVQENKDEPLLPSYEGKLRCPDGTVVRFASDLDEIPTSGEYLVTYKKGAALTRKAVVWVKNID